MEKKILVIDDDLDLLEVLSERFKANGYNVITAQNGEEGLQKVSNENPDLIVLDIMMPVMDGFQFFKEIKKDTAGKDIPILILTARGAMSDTFTALDTDGFIAKPFESTDLINMTKDLLINKALVLCDKSDISDKITSALERRKYTPRVVSSEEEFEKEAKEHKYKTIIAHMTSINNNPEKFVSNLGTFRYKTPLVILYSDSSVDGLSDNDTVAIGEVKTEWERAGIETFFDPRTAGRSFGAALEAWLS